MSSGKTTISNLLHEKLGWPVFDTDAAIVAKEKESINDIFSRRGENAFRQLETEILKTLNLQDEIILSTGGGIVETAINHDLLRQNSIVFYLKTTASAVYDLTRGDDTRPLLKVENPLATIEKKMEFRDPIYLSLADFVIKSYPRPIEMALNEILSILKTKINYQGAKK